ncbi:ribonuclease DdI-like [Brevipalpus obovatus]|uniref:ribonuclease DdI-like n=1 Tax=Brevipalpus obovatus TaxID=246614 RepID=UPI003D9DD749
MLFKSILLFAVCLCVTVQARRRGGGGGRGNGRGTCEMPPTFDEAMLSVQYAPGFCFHQSCKSHRNNWSIHGLWPNYSNGSYPQFCCNREQFDVKVLEPIREELEEYWPSLMKKSSEDFWKHEWTKHGSCGVKSKFNGLLRYFEDVVTLFKKLDGTAWLNDAGITIGGSYSQGAIQEALSKGFGANVEIMCKRKGGMPVLTEIHYCFKPSTLDKVDCVPPKRKGSCGGQSSEILIPNA